MPQKHVNCIYTAEYKKVITMKKFFVIAAVAASAMLFASCQKDNHAPVPPKAESLSIDLAEFSAPATKASSDDIDAFYTFAADQVLANWVKIFEQVIAIPVHGYELVIDSTPVESGKGWIWSVTYKDALAQTYTVKLYGEDAGKKTNWELRVSKDGLLGYEDFCWITGWSSKDGRNGQWSVKVNPLDTDVLVTIDWTSDDTKLVSAKVTYTLDHLCCGIYPFFNGSYVEYLAGASDDAYDRTINACYSHMDSELWTVKIEWNSQNCSGRVRCDSKYGNMEWHCWNAEKEDIE